MTIGSLIALAFVSIAIVGALVSVIRGHRSDRCSCGCSGCCKNCKRCIEIKD